MKQMQVTHATGRANNDIIKLLTLHTTKNKQCEKKLPSILEKVTMALISFVY